MAQGAVFEGTEFPADLWEERVPKDLAGVQVLFWWVNPQNGKQQPDQDMLVASGGTGRFDFQNDPLQVSQIPMMLQAKGKSGNWWIDVHRPGEARYLFRWKIFLGTPAQQQHTLGGITAGAYDRIMGQAGGTGQPPPPPGAAIFSKEYNAWVNPVSTTGPQGMTISGAPAGMSPEVQLLSQKLSALEASERERSQQSNLDRLAQTHKEDLARLETQRERERQEEKERSNAMLARIEQLGVANAAPRGPTMLEQIAALAPILAPLVTAQITNGAQRDREHQEFMREVIKGQAAKPGIDPIMLELIRGQNGKSAADVHLLEAMGRQSLETASMLTNMFATMKEHEPEISPIAENATRVITNVAHEVAGYFKTRANAPQLTAGPKTKEEQAKESVAFMQSLAPAEKLALAQQLAQIAQEEAQAEAAKVEAAQAEAAKKAAEAAEAAQRASQAQAQSVQEQLNTPQPNTPPASPLAPSNGASASSPTDVALAWMKQVELPVEYHTKEWAKIISDLHDERDAEEMSGMLADHLFHLWQFDALPPGLEVLDEENLDEGDIRSRFEPLKAMLPVYQKNSAYVDAVFDGAVHGFLTLLEEQQQEAVDAVETN